MPGLGSSRLVLSLPSLLGLPIGYSRCFPVDANSWKTNRWRQFHTVSSSRTPSCSAVSMCPWLYTILEAMLEVYGSGSVPVLFV
jgi:hypothetical protein